MMNGYELSIEVDGEVGRKKFFWKRTSDIEGVGAVSGKLDWLHLKLVEGETGRVVATFKHNFLYGSKRGTFVVEEFGGREDWDEIVLLSGCGVLEYLRKGTGWSW